MWPASGDSLTRLSVHESVDDLCKKAVSLWADSEMLGIVAAARTRFGPRHLREHHLHPVHKGKTDVVHMTRRNDGQIG